MRRTRILFSVVIAAAVAGAGCGAGQTVPEGHWKRKLAEAIRGEVASREQNLENSRMVEEALDQNALKDMMRIEVKGAIGQGESCFAHPECAENGFEPNDWYYTVGIGDEEKIGKRPVLILGFGPRGRVVRTWNLRVH